MRILEITDEDSYRNFNNNLCLRVENFLYYRGLQDLDAFISYLKTQQRFAYTQVIEDITKEIYDKAEALYNSEEVSPEDEIFLERIKRMVSLMTGINAIKNTSYITNASFDDGRLNNPNLESLIIEYDNLKEKIRNDYGY